MNEINHNVQFGSGFQRAFIAIAQEVGYALGSASSTHATTRCSGSVNYVASSLSHGIHKHSGNITCKYQLRNYARF